jgi:ankyrin repeat protein
VMF